MGRSGIVRPMVLPGSSPGGGGGGCSCWWGDVHPGSPGKGLSRMCLPGPWGSGILVVVGPLSWCPSGLRLSGWWRSSPGALLCSVRRRMLWPCLFEELPLGPLALPRGLRVPGLLMSTLAKGRDLEKESFWEVTPLFPGAWLCSEHSWPPP